MWADQIARTRSKWASYMPTGLGLLGEHFVSTPGHPVLNIRFQASLGAAEEVVHLTNEYFGKPNNAILQGRQAKL